MIGKGMLFTALAVLAVLVFAPAAFAAAEGGGDGGDWQLGLGVGAGLSVARVADAAAKRWPGSISRTPKVL